MVQKVTPLCRPQQILNKTVHAALATAAIPELTLSSDERLRLVRLVNIFAGQHHEICVKEQHKLHS